MGELGKYLKYYYLEEYLFGEVHENFQKCGYLTSEEFFAIVIWKSNRSKTKVRNGIRKARKSIREITSRIFKSKSKEDKINALLSIQGVGIPIASAILTVCYPKEFTVVDYRAQASLKKFGERLGGDPVSKIEDYLDYVKICTNLAINNNCSLRDFDRILFGKDFFDGENGLIDLVKGLD